MTITRRVVLSMALSTAALATGCSQKKSAGAVQRVTYGPDPSQVADLHLPPGDAVVPVAVVIHGGFWMSGYGVELATPLAEDLAAHGIAGYAIEYRRVGDGGGWPATFEDVAAAIDALEGQPRLDLRRVVAVGHSAGGHLAVWAAGRHRLPPTAPGAAPKVVLKGAVSQAGVLDLVDGVRANLGGQAVRSLMGASPSEDPARYELASPYEQVPLDVPISLVHGAADRIVPIEQSRRYRDAATRAGATVTLTELPDVGHFEFIDSGHSAWRSCREELQRLQQA
ncbi:alpha/beta hydrolase family protein [Kribbella deserti]|uniref:Alpha/beta hydrolase family protein n=1 Tax=Kribbella deserti TaxID=1926257 RepID=A0ABV6QP55_9ACTN